MTSPLSRRAASLVAALAVSVPLLATLATAPASSAPTAPSSSDVRTSDDDAPTIRWRDCGRFDCGRMVVPLDHDEPDGADITLNLVRVPARKPARRVGAVFVNPGGPGGGAADFAPYAARLLGPKVRKRFDVVGVDPRGVAGSSGLACRGRSDASYPRVTFPDTRSQRRDWLEFDATVQRLCGRERIVDHMSTADTARDMDLVRQALYGAYHAIQPVSEPAPSEELSTADVVGPVCESGDFLGRDRLLPPLGPGDLVAVRCAGAYGREMASTYNARPAAAEVFVEDGVATLVRRRGDLASLWAGADS